MRSASHPGTRTKVFHCGPAVNETGGISAVIQELTSVSRETYRHIPLATWSSSSRDRGLTNTLRTLIRLLAERAVNGPAWIHVHVSERGSFLREGILARLMARLGHRTAVTLHGADFVDDPNNWSAAAAAKLLTRADVVFCLGPVSGALVNRMAPEARCLTISNPLSPPTQSDQTALEERPTTVIFGGELSTRKGFDLLKAAWPLVVSNVPDATCSVYGPRSDVATTGLPLGMEYHGDVSREELLQAIGTAKIACLPSRREVLPMFLLESMARGLAVVTTSVGELGQLNLEHGVLKVAHDPQEIAEAISRIAANETENVRLGKLAQHWFVNHATTHGVLDVMESAYKKAETN